MKLRKSSPCSAKVQVNSHRSMSRYTKVSFPFSRKYAEMISNTHTEGRFQMQKKKINNRKKLISKGMNKMKYNAESCVYMKSFLDKVFFLSFFSFFSVSLNATQFNEYKQNLVFTWNCTVSYKFLFVAALKDMKILRNQYLRVFFCVNFRRKTQNVNWHCFYNAFAGSLSQFISLNFDFSKENVKF